VQSEKELEAREMPASSGSFLGDYVRDRVLQRTPAVVPVPPVTRAVGPDLLRFFAVTLVVFRHLLPIESSPDGRYAWLEALGRALHYGGWVGVDIFFVLSGFLVSGLLFDEWQRRGSVAPGRFLVRRAFKIYPSFWLLLFVTAVLYFIMKRPLPGHFPVSVKSLLGELLFVQNFAPSVFFHTWSLAVEEHFYLFLAGIVWILLRRNQTSRENPFQSIPWLFLCTAALCLALRIVSNRMFPPPPIRAKHIFFATYLRMDSLFFGVLIAYLWRFRFTPRIHQRLHRFRFALIALGVGLLFPMFFADPLQKETTWIRVYGFILCYLGGGALLLGFLKAFDGSKSKLTRFIAFLGASSYPVYLWHATAIILSVMCFTGPGPGLPFLQWVCHCLIAFVLAWGIGVAASRLVETPVLKLRDRWFPSRTAGARAMMPVRLRETAHLQTPSVIDRL
jgi:peptidoglycan/LPS O-acetylase OafA/YrhL